ncbi:nuclear transport factor 2 family protein [Kineosporia mesophila]|uniref:Nuclear transport factor 2 family protein n=1 Tax=Kineosporia mesophila TaxID=566012 RepID=A0ABP6ZIW3_9ACTN|nr:nuclear transport factor 2 family protein [Kineosporia mesophila]
MDAFEQTVRRYLALLATGTTAEIIDCFAPGATVEDPAGGPVLTGPAELEKLYGSLEGRRRATDLHWLRVGGPSAVFGFTLSAGAHEIDVVEVMTFDTEAKITSMRAFWSPDDVVTHSSPTTAAPER